MVSYQSTVLCHEARWWRGLATSDQYLLSYWLTDALPFIRFRWRYLQRIRHPVAANMYTRSMLQR